MPSLKTTQQDYLKSIENYHAKFTENKERLREVRVEKAKKRERELESNKKIKYFIWFILIKNSNLILDELEEDNLRNNDDMSVSDMSHTSFDNESNAGSTKSAASTVNSQYSNK